MIINRNMSAVVTNRQLLRIENKLAASMERLSTGIKLNHAGDNPAGVAISNKMKTQIDALDQAETNASDAISVVQIADGALNEVSSMLQRMRELAVQAANGTNAFSERQSIQEEIDELQKEVDRISQDTEYNTKPLLDGSSDVRVYAEKASRMYVSDTVDPATYMINVEATATQAGMEVKYSEDLPEGTININGVTVEVSGSMPYDEYLYAIRTAAQEAGCMIEADETAQTLVIKSEYFGTDEGIEITCTQELAEAMGISESTEGAVLEDGVYIINKTGTNAKVSLPSDYEVSKFTSTTSIVADGNRVKITDSNGFMIDFLLNESYEPTAIDEENGNYPIEVTDIGSMTIQIGANEFQTMDVRITEVSSTSLYIDAIDVSKVNGAERAMTTLDDAIAKLTECRSRLGAFQNRLEYATASLAETGENMTSAYSGIMDTDMAEEMTNYTQQQILSQAATSVLAQANEIPQQVLSLLR
ncbi:MAG: flagellin [Lachnospiraceae bacterium]|nr:flagellin [Lachnospiraceae bacterium]